MRRWRALLAAGAAAPLLSGCIAAAVPVAAAGVVGKHELDRRHAKQEATEQAQTPPALVRGPGVPPPGGLMATKVPPSVQYLYGSAEAAAQQRQTYLELANFLIAKSSDRAVGHPVKSVVLAPGSTLDQPVFEPCGDKPLAVVLDADETAILNYGFEGDQVLRGGAYDQQRWNRWEQTGQGKVRPVPGVLDALEVARQAGVTVVINSNRLAANADATAATLKQAGLGSFTHLDTLWLSGDAGSGSGKDARRWAISAKYCVVAMVGDQLGDFSDLFNAPALGLKQRREALGTRDFEVMWGQGWFILPNPVYGTALKGDYGAVFPVETRWSDPAETQTPTPSGSAN
ncbi:HAD family acid phosphatase [Hephaestia mangrovi]|uniref:HAD family acid phosphatase n=1 Tax=Hephaestia mangrovi TaxID=2873268 RepID=UPI0034E28D3F